MSKLAATARFIVADIRPADRVLGAGRDARRQARRRRLDFRRSPSTRPGGGEMVSLSPVSIPTSGLTLIFGLIDLASTSPFMLKYEAVVTNVATGLAFVAGALGEKPIVQEVAEQRGETFVATSEVRAFFRLFTLVWAGYFFLKAAFYVWVVWTLPMLKAMALALRHRERDARPHDRAQRHSGASALFLGRRGLLPKPDAPNPKRRRFAGEDRMTIRSNEAAAMLADVDSVVARVKQSRVYRSAALIIILWGAVDLVPDVLVAVAPRWFGRDPFLIDLIGVAGTLVLLRNGASPVSRFPFRILAAFALFYAFGWIWSDLLGKRADAKRWRSGRRSSCSATRLRGFGSARRSPPSACFTAPGEHIGLPFIHCERRELDDQLGFDGYYRVSSRRRMERKFSDQRFGAHTGPRGLHDVCHHVHGPRRHGHRIHDRGRATYRFGNIHTYFGGRHRQPESQ